MADKTSTAAKLIETETPREPVDVTTQVTKKMSVTFSNGLPMGTCARFKHDGEIWIAYPAKKMARITTVIDRLLGVLERMTDNTVRILNNHPDNAGAQELAVATLGSVESARQKWHDLAVEKVKAVTS
jgi:hypothetical protein